MTHPPLHCPFLFHGPRCVPGSAPSKRYGCIGDFKKAWQTACTQASLPVGRKNGGYVFHHTRNTAATNLRATGNMSIDDVMQVGGWKTAHVVRHYDLGNVEALRERLGRARRKVAAVTGPRDRRQQRVPGHESAGSCTAAAQQEVASGTTTR